MSLREEPPEMLTLCQAADALNASTAHVKGLQQGLIAHHGEGSCLRIYRDSMLAYKARNDQERQAVLDELAVTPAPLSAFGSFSPRTPCRRAYAPARPRARRGNPKATERQHRNSRFTNLAEQRVVTAQALQSIPLLRSLPYACSTRGALRCAGSPGA